MRPDSGARTRIAWLFWCLQQGYVKAEDRDVLHNWLDDDPATLHPGDAGIRPHLLAMADEVIAAVRDDLIERVRELHKPQEQRYIRSVAYECHGCDQGPHFEDYPGWPCATAEIVYTPGEIAAVEARRQNGGQQP